MSENYLNWGFVCRRKLYLEDKDAQIIRNVMLVYPYIKSGVMSHGTVAEIVWCCIYSKGSISGIDRE